ncbi:efflux RND transporter periplasmic adaptor subunit [Paraburkholderia sp. BL25I1N1]|uniref:efflux RND transporter periplasmic adaptor subunit n=1 Tax=Paraburkholderia sp. BL25I1N1 TaxID=1938804 RepID=UPI000D0627E2|nr:efflux RND transporter periplasmic adaptor subunit [Paraburkholderia sp. BL25I1N1]PRY04542.1 membrane fusion protein (multidrug efflux system) [Paraburkholderia sp. BL25I1N1]
MQKRKSFRLVCAATAAVLLAACGQQETASTPQVPEVGTITVEPQAVPVVTELPGRTSAFLVAQVRARVDGIVLRREFTEGAQVKAGQRLYKIDPAPYIAALNSAKAALAKAKANLASTTAQANRYKVLVAASAISRQDYDNAVAAQGQAAADVAAGEASVDTAQINLGYTDVVSPVTGQVGMSQVTPGAYIQAGQATLMATVQQLDRVYVDLMQSSLAGLRLRREIQEDRLKTDDADSARVSLVLEDGSTYPEQGTLQFTDVTVDQGTGSVTIRAVFPNRNHVLLPGMFVRARIQEGVNGRALLVPQVGVTHDPKGQPAALVVDKDNKAQLRVLQTATTYGQYWVVESGLNPGDRVIVQGAGKVQPGAPVKAVAAQLPPAPAATEASPEANGARVGSGVAVASAASDAQ